MQKLDLVGATFNNVLVTALSGTRSGKSVWTCRCNNTLIEIGGRTQTLTQWSRESGVNRTVILRRKKRGITGHSLIQKGIIK